MNVASRSMSLAGSTLGALSLEDHPGSLPLDLIDSWDNDLDKDPQWALSKTILERTNMNVVLQSRQAAITDQMVFSDRVTMEGNPVTNQLSSGRCWLFAMCNVVRIFTSRKYNLDEFQLSQSYLFFYDHLSKANWFLEQMIDLADDAIDARIVQYMLAQGPAQDGGQWDLAVALVETYGLVPQTVYPESFNSSNSDKLDGLLTSKLREFALDLRVRWAKNRSTMRKSENKEDVRALKEDQLKVVYRILTICCGTPHKPDEDFIWEFADKDKKYHRVETTPLEFARKHAGYNPSDTISIVNDPRHPWKVPMTVERLGNVVGGRPLRYLNMPSDTLKQIAISLIQSNIPVWFGCDVDKSSNTDVGIMDLRLFDYQDAFGTVLGLNKEERLRLGDSSMTHAMMFTAVHIDDVTGKPVRWRVENSWGPNICNKGFLVMTDAWFDEYVFQIAAPRAHVPRQLLDIYDRADEDSMIKLPAYDPLGLAA
ncbi:hypothetical protein JCM5296_006983 [Sporobolomyces johnsonii]